jgi:predicted dehydrogenase
VFTDIEDLLELDQVDAVVIATPNHLHEPHVLRALKSKVDVLCERPLSLTSRGVERILAAAKQAGRKVSSATTIVFVATSSSSIVFSRAGSLVA